MDAKRTQEEIAETVGITTRFLMGIENEEKRPSIDILLRLVETLNISGDAIFHPKLQHIDTEDQQLLRQFMRLNVRDKYHFIRQVTWAIENVRKRLQRSMPISLRKYYKRSRKLILTRYKKLKDENKQACDLMLHYSEDLRLAHRMKEWFYDICQMEAYRQQQREFDEWIANAQSCGIREFEACARTYRAWRKEILNAFKYGLTNDPTEGFNNKIKVLKRAATESGISNGSEPEYFTVHHRIKRSVMRRLIWHAQNQ